MLDYIGLMDRAKKEAAKQATLMYPPGDLRESTKKKLTIEIYSKLVTPSTTKDNSAGI